MIAAKRAAKKADREANSQPLPNTKQDYYEPERGLVDEERQQQGQYQWEDEKPAYQDADFQDEKKDINAGYGDKTQSYHSQGAGERDERSETLQVSPPRYSMVMRD